MHKPMPAYRAARRLWYVELDKKQVPLGKHPDGVPEPKKVKTKGGARGEWNPPNEIWQEYYRVMAEQGREDLVPPPSSVPLVAEVLDEYLVWLKGQPHKAARTVRWYEDYLQSFLDSLPDQAIAVDTLTPNRTEQLGSGVSASQPGLPT